MRKKIVQKQETEEHEIANPRNWGKDTGWIR